MRPLDTAPRRILVLSMGGIGNLILLTPALRALRARYPSALMVLLTGEPGVAAVLDNEGLVDQAPCLADAPIIPLLARLRAMRFDLSLTASHTNPLKAGALVRLLGIPRRAGQTWRGRGLFYTDAVTVDDAVHETDGALALLNTIGIVVPEPERWPRLTPTALEIGAARQFLAAARPGAKILIGMHAGSGGHQAFKRWPADRFVALADRLSLEFGATVVFTGGRGERMLVDEMVARAGCRPVNAAGVLAIRETVALIKSCRLFISNDSGLAHIAAAVGTPLIALFGPTNPARIAPRGKAVRIIRKTAGVLDRPAAGLIAAQRQMMELIQVDDVCAAARASLGP